MLTGTIARILEKTGRTMTLQSRTSAAGSNDWTEGTVSAVFTTCRARERAYFPSEIKGGLKEGDLEITIDAATCSRVPKKGDKIAAGDFSADNDPEAQWRQIVGVVPVHEATTVVLYKLQARG